MGLFNSIGATAFPTRHPRMHVFVSLTNYVGEAPGELKIIDPEGSILAQMGNPLRFNDKLATVELNVVINGIVFPKPGVYTIEFLVDQQLVGSRKIQVGKIKKEEE